jgi:glycosyltransferase involved in cell wall biosynthesis
MRVVLDLHAFPVPAVRHQGIDRYSVSLARAMLRYAGKHDVHVVVNHSLEDAVEELQNEFPDVVQSGKFRLSQLPFLGTPAANGRWHRGAAELLREHALLQLRPDVVLCSSLTRTIDAQTFSKLRLASVPTAIALNEQFPPLNWHAQVLDLPASRPSIPAESIGQLRQAELVLTISEYCRGLVLDALKLQPEKVIVIAPAADERFRPAVVSAAHERAVRMRFALNHDFIMSVGGSAGRNNVERLVEAYALLPFELRRAHQLAVVGGNDDDEIRRLIQFAQSKGLTDRDLVLTGYVGDDELVTLYNACRLFVFPSLGEIFAQPALEAMSCGAPVIGSDRGGIPEVIGLPDALFDPASARRMSEKIHEVLAGAELRAKLKAHALEQASGFSWRESARRTLEALERLRTSRRETSKTPVSLPKSRRRMAYVSPLPPERSGIADYSTELLPELAKYYEIDLITDLTQVGDPHLQKQFRRVSFSQFQKSARRYERILYHIGNSPFHGQIPSLLERYPGPVALHDFFLSHLFYHLDGIDGVALWRSLYVSHGYPGLLSRARKGADAAVWAYPCNLSVLSQAAGIIVHSEHARELARDWFGISADDWKVIPQLRTMPRSAPREEARRALGIAPDTFLVCSFGFVAPAKLNDLLFRSWLGSSLGNRKDCHLVFVGGDGEGRPYQVNGISSSRVGVTGYLGKEDYERYLAAADVGVQLRGELSRGETPRSVLDCMAYGLATIVSAHPALADLPGDSVLTLSEGCGMGELVAALERLHREPEYRAELGRHAQQYVREARSPALVARQYAQAVEEFATDHPVALTNRVIENLAGLPFKRRPSDDELGIVSSCIAESRRRCGVRQLLVDVTVLFSLGDYQTGIHRVTRAALAQLLENPPAGYRVEPVFRTFRQAYRYARTFTSKALGLEGLKLEDAPAVVNPGDIFLGLDWDPGIDEPAANWLLRQRRRGMRTVFTIYDLLPLQRSDWFKPEMEPLFRGWFSQVCRVADGFVCISRAVADDLTHCLDTHQPVRSRALDIGYFHLGSDVESSWASQGLSAEDQKVLDAVKGRTVIVMIGTVEPRKGHSQALSAMERLWAEDEGVSLVICGKQGWMVEPIAQRLRSHGELGRRLFWMDQATDEALLQLYSIASGMLMASEGEGFGLPLVEAARHGVPIIARDIPVFREVAGEHAFYFSGRDPADLANALRRWLELYRHGEHPKSDKMPWLTWEKSTEQLLEVVLEGKLYKRWPPKHGLFGGGPAPRTADGPLAAAERSSLADSRSARSRTGTALSAASKRII